jgi:hypothetical protein
MTRRELIAPLIALPLALAGIAHAQETAVRGSQRPEVIDARVGGKLMFECAGRAQDILVIRLGDGSVFAAGTLAQFKAGVARGTGQIGYQATDPNAIEAPKSPKPGKGANTSAPSFGEEIPGEKIPATGGVWDEVIEAVDLRITIPGAPAAFGRGSVTLYRGAAVMDMDRIDMR